MKKTFRFLTCLATVAVAASCLQENLESNQPETKLVPMTFSAAVDDSNAEDEAKTSLNADFTVTWSETESISLFSGTSHTEFTMTSKSDDSKSAVFEGLAEQTGTYHAVYPHSAEHSMSGGMLTVNLAATQAATADGFADDVNLSAATSTSTDLQFRNVGALVGVTVGNDNIKSVILTATEEDSYLAGKANLEFVDGLPKATATEGSASVTLNGDFENGKTYYFVVYPGSYTGLEITYVNAEGKAATKKNPNTLTLARNGNATLGTIEMTEFYGYTAGEDLFIGGEGAEAGRKLLYVTEGYYNTDSPFNDVYKAIGEGDYGYYEIFTTLKAGKPYFFYTGTSDKRKLLIKGNELATVATEAEAAATVEADGVYRVRINPSNGQIGLAKVTDLSLKRAFDSKKYQFEYTGNGTWQRLDHNAEHLSNWGGEARHFYVMTLQSLDGNTYPQEWVNQGGNNMKPAAEDGDNWNVPLFDYGDMKDGNDLDRWFCDAFVYMNADVEHYAREFTNKWEYGAGEEWMQDYGLKIGGEGSEAGQAFTLITPSSYYNTGSNYADRIGTIDNNTTYLEIFTKIEAGKPYYFYSDPLNTYYFKTDEFVNAADAEGASATVDETAVYRIRINLSTKEIGMEKVEKVMYDNGWRSDYYELAYAGRGVWKAEQHRIQLHLMGDGRLDNRYKFQMFFQGQDTIQGLGGIDGASDGYWVQPTNAGNWDERLFFLPSTVADGTIADRYSADVVLYMNNDKGHYTHSFENVTDNYYVNYGTLKVGGSGTEEGMTFSYIETDTYYATSSTWAGGHYRDYFDFGTAYYEIFTQLSAGDWYLYGNVDGTVTYYNPETLQAYNTAEEAKVAVGTEGVFRIRVSAKKMQKMQVESVCGRHAWTLERDELAYIGNGRWQKKGYYMKVDCGDRADERYKILMKFAGENQEQHFAMLHQETGDRPVIGTTDAKYWWLQPTDDHQWDPAWKYPDGWVDMSRSQKSYSNLTIYFNSDSHYYHEFTTSMVTEGLELYVNIAGSSEDGHKLTWVSSDYYVTTNDGGSWHDRYNNSASHSGDTHGNENWGTGRYYEGFFRLNEGEKFYLYTKDGAGNPTAFYNPSTGEIAESAEEATVTATASEIYRLRIKPTTKKATLVAVEYVVHSNCWNGGRFDSNMTYVGKGVWTLENYERDLSNSSNSDRYRFLIKYKNCNNPQGLSQNAVSNDGMTHADAAYYHLHLSYTGWDTNIWNYPASLKNGSIVSCAAINLYMNNDKGHYTHELVAE